MHLLRWRRSPVPTQRRPVVPADASLIASLFPKQLGEYLSNAPEPEHRVVCIAFIRFSGTDAFLQQHGADELAKALQDHRRHDARLSRCRGRDVARDRHRPRWRQVLRRRRRAVRARRRRRRDAARAAPHRRRAVAVAAADRRESWARVRGRSRCAHPRGVLGDGRYHEHRRAHHLEGAAGRDLCAPFRARPIASRCSMSAQPDRSRFKGKKVPMLVYEVGAEIGPRRREGLQVDAFIGRANELRSAARCDRLGLTKGVARCCRSSATPASGKHACCAKQSHCCRRIASCRCARNRTARTRRSAWRAIRCAGCSRSTRAIARCRQRVARAHRRIGSCATAMGVAHRRSVADRYGAVAGSGRDCSPVSEPSDAAPR